MPWKPRKAEAYVIFGDKINKERGYTGEYVESLSLIRLIENVDDGARIIFYSEKKSKIECDVEFRNISDYNPDTLISELENLL